MPDLEERVTVLEREVATLKARADSTEEDARNIPDLIRTEFKLSNSQIARISRDVAELQRQIGELRDLPAKVDALPRVVAELVTEMVAERDRKS